MMNLERLETYILHRMCIDGTEFNYCCLARRSEILPNGGKDVPAGTMAMVSSTDFLPASERPTGIATLNRQRHLTPRRVPPTAERTMGPARMIIGELDTQAWN